MGIENMVENTWCIAIMCCVVLFRSSLFWWENYPCVKIFTKTRRYWNVSSTCSKTAILSALPIWRQYWTWLKLWRLSKNCSLVLFLYETTILLSCNYLVCFSFYFTEQKPLVIELFSMVGSAFPEAYGGWTSSLPIDIQQKLKEILGWILSWRVWEIYNLSIDPFVIIDGEESWNEKYKGAM